MAILKLKNALFFCGLITHAEAEKRVNVRWAPKRKGSGENTEFLLDDDTSMFDDSATIEDVKQKILDENRASLLSKHGVVDVTQLTLEECSIEKKDKDLVTTVKAVLRLKIKQTEKRVESKQNPNLRGIKQSSVHVTHKINPQLIEEWNRELRARTGRITDLDIETSNLRAGYNSHLEKAMRLLPDLRLKKI